MKVSKRLRDYLNKITSEEFMEIWRNSPDPIIRQPISQWANDVQGRKYKAIKDNIPHIALDCAISILEKYLEHYEQCCQEAEAEIAGAYWDLEGVVKECPYEFDKLFYYHYDLPYCIAFMEIKMIDTQLTKDNIIIIIKAFKAIRHGEPSPFTKEDKNEIEKRYTKICKEQRVEDYKRYFSEKNSRETFQ